jgi:hypothetical protein
MWFVRPLVVAAVAAGLVGCGGTPATAPAEVDVKGTVTANGQPVQKGTLKFDAVLGTGAVADTAVKIDKGTFAAKLAPGKYKVTADGVRAGATEVQVTGPTSDLAVALK